LEVRFADASNEESNFQPGLAALRDEGVVIGSDDIKNIREQFPALSADIIQAYSLPDFCQVRNPRHLQTLRLACVMKGVELVSRSPVQKIDIAHERVESVRVGNEAHRAAEYIFAGGAWSGDLLAQLGISLGIEPVKGQMVLLKTERLPFQCVIQVGHRYLVPRRDGRILIGSTEERTGFDKRNTAEAIGDLIQFGRRVVPCLNDATFETCWAGLRPYSASGKPHIGRLPQLSNACVAAGHYRHGLHLSPITAVLIRQILLNQEVMLPEDCLDGKLGFKTQENSSCVP
jgi:glycine oxidase